MLKNIVIGILVLANLISIFFIVFSQIQMKLSEEEKQMLEQLLEEQDRMIDACHAEADKTMAELQKCKSQ